MLIILLQTLLILGVLILYINSRSKRVIKEVASLKEQLETLGNVSVVPEEVKTEAIPQAEPVQEEQIMEPDVEIETQDAEEPAADTDASAYNTGKSGKIYTKEELELLIKE